MKDIKVKRFFYNSLLGIFAVLILGIMLTKNTDTNTAKESITHATSVPHEIDQRVQEQLKTNNIITKPASINELSELNVNSTEALKKAKDYLYNRLTSPPMDTKVSFVEYSDVSIGLKDRLVWKVTFVGAPVKMEGVLNPDTMKPVDKQSTSMHALTYVIIDPVSGEVLTMFSAGPMHD